jgi:hypothetical protein
VIDHIEDSLGNIVIAVFNSQCHVLAMLGNDTLCYINLLGSGKEKRGVKKKVSA